MAPKSAEISLLTENTHREEFRGCSSINYFWCRKYLIITDRKLKVEEIG
jgi:hypothetical protein